MNEYESDPRSYEYYYTSIDLNPWSLPWPLTHDLSWPLGSELFSVLIFTTSSVVFVSARIVFIFVSSTAVHIYMIFMYLQSFIL